jgi:ribosomal-protein-alanine N-acetyltransferase
MIHQGTQTLETKRLILRKYHENDAQAMYTTWASNPNVTRYMRWQPHCSVEETQEIVSEFISHYEKSNYYHWIICLKETDQPIGTIGLFIINEFDELGEFGYCLGEDYWNKGYTTEALNAVFEFAFKKVQFNRIEACHSVNNPASGEVMKKAGMTFEGLARQKYKCSLGFQDANCYAILREDYIKE